MKYRCGAHEHPRTCQASTLDSVCYAGLAPSKQEIGPRLYEIGEVPHLISALTRLVGKVDNRHAIGRDLRPELAVSDEGAESVSHVQSCEGAAPGFHEALIQCGLCERLGGAPCA